MKNQLNGEINHVTIVGKVNSGKSSIINKLTMSETSIVSEERGTTTDPVNRRMELLDVGIINVVDTAGIDDETKLGALRRSKTLEKIKVSDLLLIVVDVNDIDTTFINYCITLAKEYNIKYQVIVNKIDTVKTYEKNSDYIYISAIKDVSAIITYLTTTLKQVEEKTILGHMIKPQEIVLLVMPIDSEAPKGRIILPQQNILRECLDKNIIAICVQVNEIQKTFENIKNIKLVITDSQAFKEVNALIPDDVSLTSFSILLANYKGDINTFVSGVEHIENLTKNSNILMLESCTHNTTHEDIGQVKIPMMIEKKLGFRPNFIFRNSKDFTELENIDLIIHCGSCMLNAKVMQSRIIEANKNNIAMTNYGVVIAYMNGILEKSVEVFTWK